MAHLESMPLLPLHSVVFPHATLQLHIFEERYREMVRNCLDFDQPFGIVLIRNGSEVGGHADPYMVGTAVRVSHLHTYDDGKMDVTVHGERRFRVRRLDTSLPYLTGHVEPIAELEIEDTLRADTLARRAREDFTILIEGAMARPDFSIAISFPEDPTALSFVIANWLPLENLDKQKLLELTSTIDRLSELIPLIERQIVEAKTQHLYKMTSSMLSEWISPN